MQSNTRVGLCGHKTGGRARCITREKAGVWRCESENLLTSVGRNKEKFGGAYFQIHFDFEPMIVYVFHYFKHRGAAVRPIHAREFTRYNSDNSRDTELRNAKIQFLDIFVNCNWVVIRWQQYSTHLHTNNT